MQPKLRQLVYAVALVMVVFVITNKTGDVSAAILKRPVANIASVKNAAISLKPAHANINFGAEPKSFSQSISPVIPPTVPPVPPANLERPAVTVEAVKDNMVAYEMQASRYSPVIKIPISAKVVFKRTQVNNAFDNLGITVSYALSGTASPSDYEGLANHSVYFPPQVYEVEVVITPVVDDIYEPDGESVIFTLLSDENVRSPHYQLGKQTKAKTMIESYTGNSVFEFTANDKKEITITSGQVVNLELISNTRCVINGGQFGPVGQSWQEGGSSVPNILSGSFNLSTWTATVYPTASIDYLMQCTGYMGAQRSATVRINVVN